MLKESVPLLQHSPKKGSRDCPHRHLFVVWVERPARVRFGKGEWATSGEIDAEIRNCGCCVFGFGGSGSCRGSASSAARRPDRADWQISRRQNSSRQISDRQGSG